MSETTPAAPPNRTSLPSENFLLAGFVLENSLKRRNQEDGFTLIELSIVLVIIGLLVGGVLVGQSLIGAAEVRAQITQIDRYNSAVNTFRGKFGYLPGDMTIAAAQQYGFAVGISCTGTYGQRDGDGLLEGYNDTNLTLLQGGGEVELFWQDLSSSPGGKLIDGSFPGPAVQAVSCAGDEYAILSGTFLGSYFPAAKIGHANYVYVYETSGENWFGLSAVNSTDNFGSMSSNATISVIQAYNLDKKVDDGLPLSGNVMVNYLNGYDTLATAPNTTTSGGNSTSCYDTTTETYSVTVNNGNGGNCALSFKFQ